MKVYVYMQSHFYLQVIWNAMLRDGLIAMCHLLSGHTFLHGAPGLAGRFDWLNFKESIPPESFA
jgi:hypothetical protein